MRTNLTFAGIFVLFVALGNPISAHHSFTAEFDSAKPVSLKGTVTRVDWRNPHIWVYFDAQEADGKTTPWKCEGASPNDLTRQGWSPKTLKIADPISIEGFRSKDGLNICSARKWTLPDGKAVFGGSVDYSDPAARGRQ